MIKKKQINREGSPFASAILGRADGSIKSALDNKFFSSPARVVRKGEGIQEFF